MILSVKLRPHYCVLTPQSHIPGSISQHVNWLYSLSALRLIGVNFFGILNSSPLKGQLGGNDGGMHIEQFDPSERHMPINPS